VAGGYNILDLIPLHLDAIERSPSLFEWINSWAGKGCRTALTPTEWNTRGQNHIRGQRNADGILDDAALDAAGMTLISTGLICITLM
jgi:hypothetical protein